MLLLRVLLLHGCLVVLLVINILVLVPVASWLTSHLRLAHSSVDRSGVELTWRVEWLVLPWITKANLIFLSVIHLHVNLKPQVSFIKFPVKKLLLFYSLISHYLSINIFRFRNVFLRILQIFLAILLTLSVSKGASYSIFASTQCNAVQCNAMQCNCTWRWLDSDACLTDVGAGIVANSTLVQSRVTHSGPGDDHLPLVARPIYLHPVRGLQLRRVLKKKQSNWFRKEVISKRINDHSINKISLNLKTGKNICFQIYNLNELLFD